MRIPFESIPKSDAIDTARSYIREWEMMFEREGTYSIDKISINRGDFERLVKVLFVGIGELSK
jgi:hypothetical protein